MNLQELRAWQLRRLTDALRLPEESIGRPSTPNRESLQEAKRKLAIALRRYSRVSTPE